MENQPKVKYEMIMENIHFDKNCINFNFKVNKKLDEGYILHGYAFTQNDMLCQAVKLPQFSFKDNN